MCHYFMAYSMLKMVKIRINLCCFVGYDVVLCVFQRKLVGSGLGPKKRKESSKKLKYWSS